jgi:RimJ/RimL family protein N-acetyltransferase
MTRENAIGIPLCARRVEIRMDQANKASAAVPAKLGYALEADNVPREVATAAQSGLGYIWAMTSERWSSQTGREA